MRIRTYCDVASALVAPIPEFMFIICDTDLEFKQ
jgi:hypothetical protein